MSHDLADPAAPALVQQILPVQLFLVHDGRKEIRGESHEGAAELWWGYPDNGKWVLVELNRAPHQTSITLKMGLPIRVGEHQIRRTVGAVLIRSMKKTAQVRLDPQYIEVIAADLIAPDAGRIVAGVQTATGEVAGDHAIKAAVAITQVYVVGIGFVAKGIVGAPNHVQALGPRYIQGAQDQGVQRSENHRISADGYGQRQHRRHGEAGGFAQ